ncbi:MAG: helix-turn-helix transcriptional regulator [Acidimicrobiales bacterium]
MATKKPDVPGRPPDGPTKPTWTFLTNHGHVLVCIAKDPGIRGRDIADRVGITERAAQAIVADLVAAGYVTRKRVGRRNSYEVHPDVPVRHPVEQPHRVGELLAALADVRIRKDKAART